MSALGDEVIYDGESCNLLDLALEEMNDSSSPVRLCCLVCLFFTILVFVSSELSRNYSQTDKL
jgi:hypothetical protein